ncbi:MAG: ComEC/Rec2 family competence protein [Pirellulales bacterium]
MRRATESQPLMIVAVALAAGIVVDRHMPAPVAVWLAIGAMALAAWFILDGRITPFVAAATVPPQPDALPKPIAPPRFWRAGFAIAALLLAVAACGGLRHHLHWRLFAANDIGRFARELPQPVCLEVVALSGPRRRPAPPPDPLRSVAQSAHTMLRVRATAMRDGDFWRTVDGRATLMVDGSLLGVQAGDRLRVVGQLQAPPPPGNPGEFDFAWHRRGDRELAAIRVDHPDCVQVVETAPAYSVRRALGKLRSAGDRLLWGTLSHERAGLAAAVLLGTREQLDDEVQNQFLVTGTVHILSISGLHVGILAYVLFKAFRTGWIPRGPALVAVAVITLSYALLTDAEPPALRATVLVWAVCGATYLGRGRLGANSLALAAIVVLALNPADLFRTGTQLSFLSVATLMALGPCWPQRRREDALTRLIRVTRPWPVRASRAVGKNVGALAFAGLMIWLVTSPLVARQFHIVSLSALVLNVVLWIPVLIAMVSGFAILAFGWLLPPLGALSGAVCDFNLGVIEWSIDAAARVPGSHLWVAGPPAGWLYVYYALLALPLLTPKWISHRRSLLWAGAWIGATVVYAAVSQSTSAERELVCGFVSVGHGSAVVLELPDGQVWLYDAGRLGSPRAGARSIEAYLRSRRISHIDAIILSHADIDHYNAVPELLDKFTVSSIYVSRQMFREETFPLTVLREAVAEAGVPVETLSVGDVLIAGDCIAKVLHPPPQGVDGNDNAQSIVLSVEHDRRRLLLTGDLESEGMRRLLAAPPLDCDILLAPHHGSARSDPAAVVNWSTPEWAIVSSGQGATQLASQYQPLLGPRALNTAEAGAVRARLSGERVEVRAWRIDPWD